MQEKNYIHDQPHRITGTLPKYNSFIHGESRNGRNNRQNMAAQPLKPLGHGSKSLSEKNHDAFKLFEDGVGLTLNERNELEIIKNNFKRANQQNFSTFVQDAFKRADFIYEKGNKIISLYSLLEKELEKAQSVTEFSRIIIFTNSLSEICDVEYVLGKVSQNIPYLSFSSASSELIDDAAEMLLAGQIKVLILTGIYVTGNHNIYCDLVINFSLPSDVENFVLLLQNIKMYSKCITLVTTKFDFDLIRNFAELFKITDSDVPQSIIDVLYGKQNHALSDATNQLSINDTLVNLFDNVEHEYKVLRPYEKYYECATYLKNLLNGSNDIPRVIIITDSYNEIDRLLQRLQNQNIPFVTINDYTKDDEITSNLHKFYGGYFLISKDTHISGRDISCDIVINFSLSDSVEKYAKRLRNIKHKKCLTYIDGYNNRFLLRNISNILKSSNSEVPESLKNVLCWSNCGTVKIDDVFADTQIDGDKDEDEQAMLMASKCKKIEVISDMKKPQMCYNYILDCYRKVLDVPAMPKSLIFVNTAEEAKEVYKVIEGCGYPCRYLPENTSAEMIKEACNIPVLIVHDNICETVKNLYFKMIIHCSLPADIGTFINRLKTIKHESSYIYACVGRDTAIMNKIVEIVGASKYLKHDEDNSDETLKVETAETKSDENDGTVEDAGEISKTQALF
uniref:Helicase C-terminal domain-containing protein n=1 Tax=Panagrolaimus superbus TaxID=310955 RepID=A0A914YVZ0_9BILA